MPLSWCETSKPAFSSALTRKRRMSLSSSASRILCMGGDQSRFLGGSVHSLSPTDGKYRVKAGRPSATLARSFVDRITAEINEAQGFDAFQAASKLFRLADGSRLPTMPVHKELR